MKFFTSLRLTVLLLISAGVADAALTIKESIGNNLNNTAQTNSIASWNVLEGDLIVISGAFNKGDNLSVLAASPDTAAVGMETEVLTSGYGAITEVAYYPVTASGSLDVSVGKVGTAYATYGLYLLRADSGNIEIIDSATYGQTLNSNISTFTNQYGWAGARYGILIEGVSGYDTLTLDAGMTELKVNSNSAPKRGAVYRTFSELSSLDTVYSIADPDKQASIVGFVFSEMAGSPDTFEEVALSSPELYVQGAKYLNIDGNGMNFHRFDFGEIYANVNTVRAKTTSGVKLTLYTRSDTVRLTFDYVVGDEYRNSSKFTTYQNGEYISTPAYSLADPVEGANQFVLELMSASAPGQLVRHDVVMPNWANPILSKVELKTGDVLEVGNPFKHQQIVFLGDSISHGTGQGTTAAGYPYQVAEELNMELFNLAVGGGKIAPEVSDLLQDFETVDAIWILVGYNDWQGSSKTVVAIEEDYEALLESVRTHQPNAEVFCCTLVATTVTNDLESGVAVGEVRQAISGVVNARITAGDDQLHLVDGNSISSSDAEYTMNTKVHFTELGAADFASNVVAIVEPIVIPPKPNVLFIAIDDINPILGCYGNDLIQTPHMDALADRGMVFLNAHCQWAVCGPSRASLMSGLMPEQTGVTGFKKMRGDGVNDSRDNAKGLTNLVTIPQHFIEYGYATAASGKINDNRCVGSINPDGTINEDGGSVDDPPSWSHGFLNPGGVNGSSAYNPALGKNLKRAAESIDQPGTDFVDGVIASAGLEQLEMMATNQPFFLGVGFKKPHLPFLAPKANWDQYDRDDFTPHPFQTEMENVTPYTFNNVKEMRDNYYLDLDGDGNAERFVSGILPEEQQKELLHGYYASISHVDDQVGRVLVRLDELGLASNTIVVLWGDHGFHLGDHNEWGKHTNLEQATRVPFIISAPGYAPGRTEAPVGLLDIYPTLCELADLPIPEQPTSYEVSGGRPLAGKSLLPIIGNSDARVQTGIMNHYGGGTYGYAYHTERYRYTEWINSSGTVLARELYDYQEDPMETVNLAVYPEYEILLHQFSEAARNEAGGCERLQTAPAFPAPTDKSMPGLNLETGSIRWPDAQGRQYNMLSKTNLSDSVWTTSLVNLASSPAPVFYGKPQAFYRVELVD